MTSLSIVLHSKSSSNIANNFDKGCRRWQWSGLSSASSCSPWLWSPWTRDSSTTKITGASLIIFTIIYWWVWYLIEEIKFWLLLEVTPASSIPHVLCFRVLFSSLQSPTSLLNTVPIQFWWTVSKVELYYSILNLVSINQTCWPCLEWKRLAMMYEEEVVVAEYWSLYPDAYMSAWRWVALTDIFQILVPAWLGSDGPISQLIFTATW